MIRILVADAHGGVLDGLVAAFTRDPAFTVTSTATTAVGVLDAARALEPDVALIGTDPTGIDAAAVCGRLRGLSTRIRTLVAVPAPQPGQLREAFAAEARGVVLKTATPALLRAAVRTIADGWVFVDPRVARQLVQLALAAPEPLADLGRS